MIDIHSHIIFGVDDGPTNIEEAVTILKTARQAGVSTIVATPHYRKELHENGKVNENYQQLKDEAIKLGIELLKGFEIRIGTYADLMTEDYNELTLNRTKYLLIELPFDRVPGHTFDTIYDLQQKSINPVLAHPERCAALVKDIKLFKKIIDTGCLMQVDAASILGLYGRRTKCVAKKMLRMECIHFVASDAHSPKGYSEWYIKAYEKVKKWVGQETAVKLFSANAGIILAGAGK